MAENPPESWEMQHGLLRCGSKPSSDRPEPTNCWMVGLIPKQQLGSLQKACITRPGSERVKAREAEAGRKRHCHPVVCYRSFNRSSTLRRRLHHIRMAPVVVDSAMQRPPVAIKRLAENLQARCCCAQHRSTEQSSEHHNP
eukprot:3797495-Prymnesium_polylepis.2